MAQSNATADPEIAHIEALVRAITDAINARNFDQDTFPWHIVTTDFQANNRFTGERGKAAINAFADICQNYPDLHITIKDLATSTYVRNGVKCASVYMNAENRGGSKLAGAVSRQIATVFTFESRRGVWWWTSEQSLDGFRADGMPG